MITHQPSLIFLAAKVETRYLSFLAIRLEHSERCIRYCCSLVNNLYLFDIVSRVLVHYIGSIDISQVFMVFMDKWKNFKESREHERVAEIVIQTYFQKYTAQLG